MSMTWRALIALPYSAKGVVDGAAQGGGGERGEVAADRAPRCRLNVALPTRRRRRCPGPGQVFSRRHRHTRTHAHILRHPYRMP